MDNIDTKNYILNFLYTRDLLAFGLTNRENSKIIDNDSTLWTEIWNRFIENKLTNAQKSEVLNKFNKKKYILNFTGARNDLGLRTRLSTIFLQAVHRDYWYSGIYRTNCILCKDITSVISLTKKTANHIFVNDIKPNIELFCDYCQYRYNQFCQECFTQYYVKHCGGIVNGKTWICTWCKMQNHFNPEDVYRFLDYYLMISKL
jgi:hypothetical protein